MFPRFFVERETERERERGGREREREREREKERERKRERELRRIYNSKQRERVVEQAKSQAKK